MPEVLVAGASEGDLIVRVRGGVGVVLAAALAAGAGEAAAEKAIPVRDLPPFPEVGTDEDALMGVTVAGAADVEEDVVTGAAKREQSLGTVASAVTVIPGDRLRRFGYRTLSEALAGVVGIYIADDRMVERVGIRGVQLLGDANTRILVLVDGSPVNEPWSQYVDGSFALPVHLDDVARIEIVRGPVSSVYGTNAFLGIINIVTLEADKAPRVYGRSGYGSFGAFMANAGFGYGSLNRQVRGTLSWTRSGGEALVFAPEGSPPVATDQDGVDAVNGSVTVNYERLFFHVRGYDRTRELPGAPYNSEFNAGNQQRDRQILAEAGYNQPIGDKANLSGRLYLDRYQSSTDLAAKDIVSDGMGGNMVERFGFDAEGNALWYGGEVRGLYDVLAGGKLSLTAGVSAEFARTDSTSTADRAGGAITDVVEKDFDTQGVYVEASSQPYPWIAATGGVRYDVNSLFDDRLSPRGAFFLQHGKRVGLKLLYAEGFRNPSVFEAFYADPYRYRPNLDADGSTGLRPESTTAMEVVIWGRPVPALNLRLSLWKWDMTDLIEKSSVMQPAPINDTRLQYRNVGEVVTTGVETEAIYRDTRGWMGFVNCSLASVEVGGGLDPALNAPALVASTGLSTPILFEYVHVSTELTYVGARRSREALTPDDPETVDAHLGLNLALYAPSIEGFDVTLGARNLLGARPQTPAQSDYDREEPSGAGGVDPQRVYTIPGAARELFLRVGYRY